MEESSDKVGLGGNAGNRVSEMQVVCGHLPFLLLVQLHFCLFMDSLLSIFLPMNHTIFLYFFYIFMRLNIFSFCSYTTSNKKT